MYTATSNYANDLNRYASLAAENKKLVAQNQSWKVTPTVTDMLAVNPVIFAKKVFNPLSN
jgi:hypothetical protein